MIVTLNINQELIDLFIAIPLSNLTQNQKYN